MKKIFVLAITFLTSNSFANNYQLGIIAGNPTGISGKVEMANNRSIDGVLSYSLSRDIGIEFHTDYLVEKVKTFNIENVKPMDLYYGVGARFIEINGGADNGHLGAGVRAPVGVSMQIEEPRLEVFGELALAFDLIPSTNLELEGGVGVRYKF